MLKVNLLKKTGLIASLIYASACGAKIEDDKPVVEASDTGSVIMNQSQIDVLLKKAIDHGDCDSYQEAVVNRHLAGDTYSLYIYSQIMANKYNCAIAYYYLGIGLESSRLGSVNIFKNGVKSIDNKTKNTIIYNYLKAHELGNNSAKYKLHEYFGKDETKFPKSCEYIIFPKLDKIKIKGC